MLQAIRDGLSNPEIAVRFEISPNTVKKHVAHLLHKLGARNRAHAVELNHAA